MKTGYDAAFWQAPDKLVADSKIIIERLKGSHHPTGRSFMQKRVRAITMKRLNPFCMCGRRRIENYFKV